MACNKQEQILTDRKRRIIATVLSCRTVVDGCRLAHVSRETWYQYLRDPAFKAEYSRQSQEVIQSAIDDLKLLVTESVQGLGRLLRSGNENVRLKALLAVIEHVQKFREQEISDRLTELERYVEQKKERR